MSTSLSTKSSVETMSEFYCPHAPNISWYFHDTALHWAFGAILSICSPAVIILNLLVIIAVKQRKELQKQSYILLSSMAIADLLAGVISMPLTVAFDLSIVFQAAYPNLCILRLVTEFSMISLVWSSLYHLTVIAWERYVAIRKPLKYKAIMTKESVKKMAICAWMLALFTSFPPLIIFVAGVNQTFKQAWHIGESICAMLCLTLIIVFYIMVYLGAWQRKLNKISQVTALVEAKLATKVAKTTGMLTAALIVSVIPMCVAAGLGEAIPGFGGRVALRFAETAIQFNSLLSPLLYCYRDLRFRNAVLELLRIRKPQTIQPNINGVRYEKRERALNNDAGPQYEKCRGCQPRSASSDLSVIMMKRSLSVPSIKTSVFNSGKQSTNRREASQPRMPELEINKIPRSRRLMSWHASASVIVSSTEKLTVYKRRKTALF